jgi:hypothetical protein
MINLTKVFQPEHFVLPEHYWDTFGHTQTEISAKWVMRFLQDRGKGWEPFTYDEINNFYNTKRIASGCEREKFTFNRLLPGKHKHDTTSSFLGGDPEYRPNPGGIEIIEMQGEEVYRVTDDFIRPLIPKYLVDNLVVSKG